MVSASRCVFGGERVEIKNSKFHLSSFTFYKLFSAAPSYLASTIQEVVYCSSQEWQTFYDRPTTSPPGITSTIPLELRYNLLADFGWFSPCVCGSWGFAISVRGEQNSANSVASLALSTAAASMIFITFAMCDCNGRSGECNWFSIRARFLEMQFISMWHRSVGSRSSLQSSSLLLPRESFVSGRVIGRCDLYFHLFICCSDYTLFSTRARLSPLLTLRRALSFKEEKCAQRNSRWETDSSSHRDFSALFGCLRTHKVCECSRICRKDYPLLYEIEPNDKSTWLQAFDKEFQDFSS